MSFLLIITILTSGIVVLNIWLLFTIVSEFISNRHGNSYVTFPKAVGRKMLQLAEVKKNQIVFDLGCGDARLLLLALREHGVKKAVGIEIAPKPYLIAKLRTFTSPKIKIRHQDMFKTKLNQADIILLYLTSDLLKELKSKLKQELKPGSKVITARYSIPGWQEIKKDTSARFPIFVYQL